MKTFYFTVRGDHITKKEDYVFIEGNKGSYEAVFDFGEEWDEMAKVCIVENGEDVYKVPTFGNSCLLPEVCGSSARIGVIGVDALDAVELVTRISTNMLGIGIQDGAASREVTAELNTAAAVWEKYLSDMENSRKAAEVAKDAAEKAEQGAIDGASAAALSAGNAEQSAKDAKLSAENTLKSEETAGGFADNAEKSKADAETASQVADESAKKAEKYAGDAYTQANRAGNYAENAKSYYERTGTLKSKVETIEEEAENRLTVLKQDIQTNLNEVQKSANDALSAAEEAEGYAQSAKGCENEAANYAGNAITAMNEAEQSEKTASQALSDLLAMINSGDIILATDGKLPLSSIPATATQEIYTVTSENELTSLTAQRGDLAELIEVVDGERTITKTWQCLGDASVRENWVVWGTSYAVQSGNARAADNSLNANMINNHRMVEMTEEEFAAAVKDENTYYLVY